MTSGVFCYLYSHFGKANSILIPNSSLIAHNSRLITDKRLWRVVLHHSPSGLQISTSSLYLLPGTMWPLWPLSFFISFWWRFISFMRSISLRWRSFSIFFNSFKHVGQCLGLNLWCECLQQISFAWWGLWCTATTGWPEARQVIERENRIPVNISFIVVFIIFFFLIVLHFLFSLSFW